MRVVSALPLLVAALAGCTPSPSAGPAAATADTLVVANAPASDAGTPLPRRNRYVPVARRGDQVPLNSAAVPFAHLHLSRLGIFRTSGIPAFDAAAFDAVDRAQPFEPPPL